MEVPRTELLLTPTRALRSQTVLRMSPVPACDHAQSPEIPMRTPVKKRKIDGYENISDASLRRTPVTPKTPKLSRCGTGSPRTPLSVKRTLSTSELTPIKERVGEKQKIKKFIAGHIEEGTSGSLYISGKPGTGKTACINEVLSEHDGEKIFCNCMVIDNPRNLYLKLLNEISQRPSAVRLRTPLKAAKTPTKSRDSMAELESILIDEKRKMILLVLDEVDTLQTRDLDVIRKIFLWPTLPGSRIILIAISNVLDPGMFEKSLPSDCKPSVLHFQPYTIPQIKSILSERLKDALEDESVVFDDMALEFCARKTAAVSGDIRTALNMCRRGIQLAEQQCRKLDFDTVSPVKEKSECLSFLCSPRKKTQVKISHIQAVLSEQTNSKNPDKLPMQQRILICCAAAAVREGKNLTIGGLTDTYRKKCPLFDLDPLATEAVADLCGLLSENGVFDVKKEKNVRFSKLTFLLSEDDVEFRFGGKALLGRILSH